MKKKKNEIVGTQDDPENPIIDVSPDKVWRKVLMKIKIKKSKSKN